MVVETVAQGFRGSGSNHVDSNVQCSFSLHRLLDDDATLTLKMLLTQEQRAQGRSDRS